MKSAVHSGVHSEVQSVLHIALYKAVHSAVNGIVQSYALLYSIILCYTQTWNLTKNRHDQISERKILHTENAEIETIFANNKQQTCIILVKIELYV